MRNWPFALGGAVLALLLILANQGSVAHAAVSPRVCVTSSNGAGISGAAAQYYASGWHQMGTTGADGCVTGPSLTGVVPVGVTLGGIYNQQSVDFNSVSTAQFTTVAATMRLLDSAGAGLAGGAVQYYANGWHQIGTTSATGTVTTELLPGNTPFGMTYGGIYSQLSQDPTTNPLVTFQTVRTTVRLVDSSGAGLAGGVAQYYANGWHPIGTTPASGELTAELLPGSTPFGMTYGGVYSQVSQDPATSATVTFRTLVATVRLVDSTGSPLAGGAAQYYANGWHQMGVTGPSGEVSAEVLAGSTPFGMTYGGIYNQVSQDPTTSPLVTFHTIATTVRLANSTGAPVAGGVAQYYASGWHQMGTTGASGEVTAELLSGNTPFGMTYGGVYSQLSQDPSANAVVVFRTAATTVRLVDSAGAPLAGGTAQYYANGWHQLGATAADGTVQAELLAGNTPFGMTYGGIYNQLSQDPATNAVVTFRTVATTVRLIDSGGSGIAGGSAQYYANGWHPLGATAADGTAHTELLPGNTPFGMTYGGIYNQVSQDPGSNPVVTFQTVGVTVRVVGSNGNAVVGAAVRYYGNGWVALGNTGSDGTVAAQILAANIPFAASQGSASVQVSQSIGTNPVVVLTLAVAGTGPAITPATPTPSPTPPASTPPPAPAPNLILEFVSATADTVTWRLRPEAPADLFVWDSAGPCLAEGGADCGAIESGGAGRMFAAAGSGQQLLITQSYAGTSESCQVSHTAEYSTVDSPTGRQTVTGEYLCSGAPTLGWPLYGAFMAMALAAGSIAYVRLSRATASA